MADLIFSRPPHPGGPVHLVFGAPPPVVLPDPVVISGTSVLGGVSGSGVAGYDNRNPRRASASAALPHQVAAATIVQQAAGWQISRRELGGIAAGWQSAAPAVAQPATPWDVSARAGASAAAGWQQGAPVQAQAAAVHQAARSIASQRAAAWQAAQGDQARAHQAAIVHQVALSLVAQAVAPWGIAARLQALTVARFGTGSARAARLLTIWETARPVPPGREVWPKPSPVRPPREPSTHLVFACPPGWLGAGPVHLVFGRVCRRVPALVSIPIRRVYVTINEIDLRRVDGDVALGAHTFSMTLDADSWTVSWSATLNKSAEPLVAPFDELEARINGVPYRLAVGKVARDRRFPETRLKVSGRGLAQVLADPQAPVISYSATADRTAQQLMADVLTVNGVSMGWDIDWGLTDWLVPANAWAFQGTAMQALADIAGAVGGYIQPHPTARTLRVLPRYPSAPWTWAGVTPNLELPGQVVEVESMEQVERPAYNGVFVGGTSAGVFGPVTRAGTAGDVLAPQVNHALITHPDAHRQRGLAVLSDTGRQVHLSLSLPVLPETGLILPGPLVRYAADRTHVGIVRSTSLTWDSPVMRQTIGVECHEPA